MNRRRVFNICLSVLITAAFALLAVFVFSDSYLRFGEAVKDFGLSVGYYFCTLFGIEHNIVPSVTEYSSVMDWSILLPSDFEGFTSQSKEGSQAKHLDTAEFKAKKIVEQARGEADSIIAEADHNAERKVKIAQIHADGIVASAEQTAEKTKQQAQGYLDGIVQSIEAERCKPTPKRKRQAEEEIALLRTENAALRQSKAIADRDRSYLFEQLQKAERRAKGKEQAFGMVSDMLAAYPAEFNALLNKSRAKNSAPSFQSHGNDRGGK